VLLIGVLLTGCGAAPTPYPVTPFVTSNPTATGDELPIPSTPETAPIRIGIESSLFAIAPITDWESRGWTVVPLETNPDDATDVQVTIGFSEGRTPLPTTYAEFILALNPQQAPLDNPDVRNAIQMSLSATALESMGGVNLYQPEAPTQNTFANLGYPDGITLYGDTHHTPNSDNLLRHWAERGVTVTPMGNALDNGHLIIGLAPSIPENWMLIPLAQLPITYTHAPNIQIAPSDSGWFEVTSP
jgi:hypothetical protein